ncbi:MAG: hypothetical protein ACI4EI_13755 [Muricoprocola sp.]
MEETETVSADAANASFDEAADISVNQTYRGNLATSSDEKYYRFSLSSAGYISFDFAHEYVDRSWSFWIAELYDSNKEKLMERSYEGNTTATKTTTKIGVPAGTYYIKVKKDNYSDVNYAFRVNFTASSSWETEFNDSFNTSDRINIGNTVNGSLMESEDVDYYEFYVPSAGYISLDFTHEYVDRSWSFWEVYLYNPNKEELMWRNYAGNTTATATTTKVGVSAGTYYIKVKRDNYSDVNYALRVNFTASSLWETEFNDSFNTADRISVGNTVNGSLMESDDVDYYEFYVPNAGYISMDFSHEYVDRSWPFWEVYLYNPDKEELMWRNYAGNTTATTTTTKVGVSAGTYYIKIKKDNYSDVNYTFKVNFTSSSSWETEFNDSFDTADVITVENAVNGTLMEDDDVDYYMLQLPKSGRYQLTFEHDYIDSDRTYWKVDLFNTYKEKVQSYYYTGKSTTKTEAAVYLQSGTYYAKVYKDYHSTLRYSLKLSEDSHVHSYKTYVTKATTGSNGSIIKKCSCGEVQSNKTIYYPRTISLSTTDYHYDGKKKTPKVTVKGSDGKTISSSNYTVSYDSGRKNVGKYSVKITFKGNYTGTVYKTFYIWPKQTSITKLRGESGGFYVKWTKRTEQVSGYQIQYSRNSYFSGAVTKTITSNATASARYSYLGKNTKYYVRVRTYKKIYSTGRTYYSAWSPTKTVTTK